MDIFISLPAQTLELYEAGLLLQRYSVSTARNGGGEQTGSYCTPRGKHIIRAMIGGGQPENSVFVRRRPTGEIWTPDLSGQFPRRDWILTRILWLSGLEPGFNRLGKVDTMRRYIYLHGSPDVVPMGKPGSIGCVRMRNCDIIELFDRVQPYTPVNLGEYRIECGDGQNARAHGQAIRHAVFVQEQGVPEELDVDEFDACAHHAVAYDSRGKAIGTGGLLLDGHIGRMAVLPGWRGKGVGAALLRRLLEAAVIGGRRQFALNAQSHVTAFYARFGFRQEGAEFVEAGTSHRRMTLRIQA